MSSAARCFALQSQVEEVKLHQHYYIKAASLSRTTIFFVFYRFFVYFIYLMTPKSDNQLELLRSNIMATSGVEEKVEGK